MFRCFVFFLWFLSGIKSTWAQDNYEIQVYGAELVKKGKTMVELHSNYTLDGSKTTNDAVLPSNHIIHETIEITHGFTTWFETGFYFFNALGNDHRSTYVGSHIRPRFSIPEKWHWPVGLSLSIEYGVQKREYSTNTNTLEIRPIIDKKWGPWYAAFNPTLDQSFSGSDNKRGIIFSPDAKLSYNITKKIAVGPEYYGSAGPIFMADPYQQQQHQLFLVADIDFNPEWEFNAGYGWGFTNSSDNAIFKVILGRRF